MPAACGFAAAPSASTLGATGASVLRLLDALVFFVDVDVDVVVGFFAIAAHLRDLSASSAGFGRKACHLPFVYPRPADRLVGGCLRGLVVLGSGCGQGLEHDTGQRR